MRFIGWLLPQLSDKIKLSTLLVLKRWNSYIDGARLCHGCDSGGEAFF